MAGHSHWAGIKHKKKLVDARRGKLWSKLAKHVIVAARKGGGNPDMNLSLKYAIDKARAANMPKDNIERAIKRGTGEIASSTYEELVYEAYGPGGVALYVEVLTDNRTRTASELRKLFDVRGGSLGKGGSVAWMFEKKGMLAVRQDAVSEDELMEIALEAGAEDIQQDAELFEITTGASEFEAVKRSLLDRGFHLEVAELAMVSTTDVTPSPEEARKAAALVTALEDHDDVQNVYTNFEVPEQDEEE